MSYERLDDLGFFDSGRPRPTDEQIGRNFDVLSKRLGPNFAENDSEDALDEDQLALLIGDLDLPTKLNEIDQCRQDFGWEQDAVFIYLKAKNIYLLEPGRINFARTVANSLRPVQPRLGKQEGNEDTVPPTLDDIDTLAISTPELVISKLAFDDYYRGVGQLNNAILIHLQKATDGTRKSEEYKTFNNVEERKDFILGVLSGKNTAGGDIVDAEILRAYLIIAPSRGLNPNELAPLMP